MTTSRDYRDSHVMSDAASRLLHRALEPLQSEYMHVAGDALLVLADSRDGYQEHERLALASEEIATACLEIAARLRTLPSDHDEEIET